MARSGRRPAASGTREAIEAAARRRFAAAGFDNTSLRSIAAEAGVDPALIRYFFGSKQALFVATMALPFDPAQAVPAVFGGDPATAGLQVATFLVTMLERPEVRARLVGLVRSAASDAAASGMVRELISHQVLRRVVDELAVDGAELRAALVGSQVVGLVMVRYVVGIEPLASLPAADVVAAIAPTLQRYLTEPLGDGR